VDVVRQFDDIFLNFRDKRTNLRRISQTRLHLCDADAQQGQALRPVVVHFTRNATALLFLGRQQLGRQRPKARF
jgi:hypothetical protein